MYDNRNSHDYVGDTSDCKICKYKHEGINICETDDDPETDTVKNANIPCCDELKCYHGRGGFQLTHDYNYAAFSKYYYGRGCAECFENEPWKILDLKLEYVSALWFFQEQAYLADKTDLAYTIDNINGSLECIKTTITSSWGSYMGWTPTTEVTINAGETDPTEFTCPGSGGHAHAARCRKKHFDTYAASLGLSTTDQHDCTKITHTVNTKNGDATTPDEQTQTCTLFEDCDESWWV